MGHVRLLLVIASFLFMKPRTDGRAGERAGGESLKGRDGKPKEKMYSTAERKNVRYCKKLTWLHGSLILYLQVKAAKSKAHSFFLFGKVTGK